MAYVLLDKDGVVIQKQPHIQDHEKNMGFIEAPDSVVCGQIRNEKGKFINPPPPQESP